MAFILVNRKEAAMINETQLRRIAERLVADGLRWAEALMADAGQNRKMSELLGGMEGEQLLLMSFSKSQRAARLRRSCFRMAAAHNILIETCRPIIVPRTGNHSRSKFIGGEQKSRRTAHGITDCSDRRCAIPSVCLPGVVRTARQGPGQGGSTTAAFACHALEGIYLQSDVSDSMPFARQPNILAFYNYNPCAFLKRHASCSFLAQPIRLRACAKITSHF
jgi:hypothetical protein